MKQVLLALAFVGGLVSANPEPAAQPTMPGDEDHAPLYENEAQRNERMGWWREAKFGMFIHYGLYSGLGGQFQGRNGGGEWIQNNLNLDSDTYAEEAFKYFAPTAESAEQWAALAEEAGCRYMVLTSKHHEGFALFDTATTDFNSVKKAGQDVVRNFVDAARKHGLRVGFYHSVIDWHHPSYDNSIAPGLCYPRSQAKALKEKGIPRDHAAYQKYLHSQVRELLTNYGKIDVIWWDYSQGNLSGARGWQAPKLIEMVRSLQPGIIMNNRLYAYGGLRPESDAAGLDLRCGDFTTPEKRLLQMTGQKHDWESCMTLGNHWGFNRNDAAAYKTPQRLIRTLEQCAAFGGNLLLNVSPRGDGSLPEKAIDHFRRIGKWMAVNGEAIYGSSPVPSITLPEEWLATVVGEDTYIFPPAMQKLEGDVQLRIPAHQIDTVMPVVLGQPDCTVEVCRVEDKTPEGDEPRAYMQFTIPASAWEKAVEGLPVIKLINAH